MYEWCKYFCHSTYERAPDWAKGLTLYFGINIWSGPRFEPTLSKAWETFGRGRNACWANTRNSILTIPGNGQFSGCYVREECFRCVASGVNVISIMKIYMPRLSVHRSYSSMLYLYHSSRSVNIVSCHLHAYLVVGIKEWAGHTESKSGIAPDLGWNPTIYKVMSRLNRPETKKHTHTHMNLRAQQQIYPPVRWKSFWKSTNMNMKTLNIVLWLLKDQKYVQHIRNISLYISKMLQTLTTIMIVYFHMRKNGSEKYCQVITYDENDSQRV